MRRLIFALSLLIAPTLATAEDTLAIWETDRTQIFDAADVALDDLVWSARPILVFAQSPNDPQFRRQMELLADRPEDLAERDMIVIVDTDPEARSNIRLRLRPRSFMLALVGKDGQIKIRKPRPWDVREISRWVDKTPLRQQEVRDRRLQN